LQGKSHRNEEALREQLREWQSETELRNESGWPSG